MKKVWIISMLLIGYHSIWAQPGIVASGNQMGLKSASNGHIYGKIVDNSGVPITDASVILLENKMEGISKKDKSILFLGTSSKSKGEFSLDELPVTGTYQLNVSAVGYLPLELPVSFGTAVGAAINVGTIKLLIDATGLQAVTVTASKSLMKLDIDKKVFNVEKNIVSAGGTALDVMRNVPSVNVDIDGNISLRNSTPQLLIDGRPTTLTLEQIPADAIESVEVMTNPSASYDASGGGAGILNIVLKKNRKTGYNGSVRVGIDKRGALNGGGDISVRQFKINLSASIMGNQNKGQTTGSTNRVNLTDIPQTAINQNNFNKSNGGILFAKLGLDYFITKKTTLSLSAIKVHGEFSPNESINIQTDSLFAAGKVSNYSQRLSAGNREFDGAGLVFGLKRLFATKGEELTA
ncbi:MAG: carboxypeptidase regulatory-like domain-containing protein, partial [Chitinophagaceae bacterium]